MAATAAAPASAAKTGGSDNAVVVVTGDVEVARGESVDAVVVIDGDVRIAGHVDGSVVVVNGTTTISGSVDGDLVTIAGPARLLPGALVDGDIQYGDEKPVIARAPRSPVTSTTRAGPTRQGSSRWSAHWRSGSQSRSQP